jgi:hypothetical protein
MSTPAALCAALRAHARGLYTVEASVELLINHRVFLHCRDFRDRFVHHTASITDGAADLAAIDWHAAVAALEAGDLPRSSGEHRMLRIAASLAAGIPTDLRDCLTGLDRDNVQAVIGAVLHASGRRPEPHFLDRF